MATTSKTHRKLYRILVIRGALAAVALFVVGGLAWWAYSFTTSNVRTQLSSQEIFFPDKGSAAISALPAADQVQMNKYAGQQMVNGKQAEVYANNFIAVHLGEIAGGQTYAQVSTKALADPTNATLQTEKGLLFQGETLRGLLLGDAYAFWTIGTIAEIVAYVAFITGILMLGLVVISLGHLTKL
jgi:hypothetical protein